MTPTNGLFAANMRALTDPGAADRIARLAEDLGYDSLWVADHVVVPSPLGPITIPVPDPTTTTLPPDTTTTTAPPATTTTTAAPATSTTTRAPATTTTTRRARTTTTTTRRRCRPSYGVFVTARSSTGRSSSIRRIGRT